MAEYRLNISGAEVESRLDRVPQLINEVENHEERITVLEAGGGGGGTGSVVVVNPILTSGTKIAEISVNGSKKNLYAPNGGSGEVTDVDVQMTGDFAEYDLHNAFVYALGVVESKADASDIPTDSHINSLIDAKLTPLEELADTLNAQALDILGGL